MPTGNIREQGFRRRLALEIGTQTDPRAIAAAARTLLERFAQQVDRLIGDAGVTALYGRALYLTQQRYSAAASVHASSQDDGPFHRTQQFVQSQEPAVATEAAVAVLTTVGDLLALFIGESLTGVLLREVWPDEFVDDIPTESAT